MNSFLSIRYIERITYKILDMWEWLIDYLKIEYIVNNDPIPLGWKVQMDDWNDMNQQNVQLIQNTNGHYYIDVKDGKYYIFNTK